MNERQLLCTLKHPYFTYLLILICFSFLVNMVSAFQDRENLYLVMDLMTGGDLRYHISRHRRFTEEQTSI
jgi:serine/threonine protein kinase